MDQMVQIVVGKPWPYPVPNGMQAIIDRKEHGPTLALAMSCDKPTAAELKALKTGPLKLGIMISPPLTWIILDAGCISFDAPYARGITSPDHSRAVSSTPASVAAWPETTRGLVEVYVIDRGKVALARVVSTSRAWWEILAAGISQSPDQIDRSAYGQAVINQQRNFTTAQMLNHAHIIEVGGRV